MATQEEILRILLQVQGSDEVQRLTTEQEKLEAEMARVTAAMRGMDAATIAADPNFRKAAQQYAANQKALESLQRTMGGVGTGANAASYKLQQFGQTMDDLQYVGEMGLRPIINNLMQISPMIGIAAIAIQTVGIPAVKALWEAFTTEKVKEVGESIDELKAKIKTLEDQKTRLVFEDDELDATKKKLDEALEAKRTLDSLLGNQSEREKKSGQGVRDSLNSDAGREAIKQATEARAAEISPEDQRRIDNAKQNVANAQKSVERLTKERDEASNPIERAAANATLRSVALPLYNKATEALDRAQKEIREKGEKAFAEITRQAINGIGDKQAEAQRELTNRLSATSPFGNRGIGLDLANSVAENSPDEVARKDREKKAAEKATKDKAAADKAAKEKADAEKKAAAENKRIIDESNKLDEGAAREAFAEKAKKDAETKKAAAKQKQDQAAADRVRKQNEALIDKTNLEGNAFGMFDQISTMKGKQRRNANAETDAEIQRAVLFMASQNTDITEGQAQAMAAAAPQYYRRRYAEQLAKQRAMMNPRANRGNGFNSVGVDGPPEDDPDAGGQIAVPTPTPGNGPPAPALAQNQAGLAANQQLQARNDAMAAHVVAGAQDQIAKANQMLQGVEQMYRQLNQRQRTMQLRGR